MKPIAPNTLIQNRYLVVHLIGKGGMGEVYLAVDQRLGSAVALKRTFFSDDEQLGNAFEREARTLARLRHPVLPKVSDHFTEQGTQYLVMEHISGEDISKRLETNKKPFPLSWVLFWADHLLDSLTYLHTHEPPIVHRDIKPQNLKLTDENNIVLLDFGLSKSSGGETRISTSGSIVGYTPHYAPMEQIRGTGTDGRSDIYALSATLYQILTNVVPADALSRADAIINGMPDPIKPLNEINPEVSEAVSEVIIRGMGISQDKRFSTARDMQKALRDAFSRSKNEPASSTASLKQAEMPIPPSQIVTEVISMPTPPPIESIPAQAHISPAGNGASLNSANFETQNSRVPVKEEPKPDFDATLRYDEDIYNAAVSKQSNIQTEVLIAGSSPEITAAQNGYYDKSHSSVPPVSVEEDQVFANDPVNLEDFENFNEENDNFSPGATVPLFTLDDQKESHSPVKFGFNNIAPAGDESSAAATYIPQQHLSGAAEFKNTANVPPVQNKSSGKGMVVAGGVGAFLLVGVAAAVIGWYAFGGSGKTVTEDTPAAVPQPTLEVSPTPEPTLKTVTDNSANANANANLSTGDVKLSDESNVNAASQDETPVKNPDKTINDPNPKPRKEQNAYSAPVKEITPGRDSAPLRDPSPPRSAKTGAVKPPVIKPPTTKTPEKIDRTIVH